MIKFIPKQARLAIACFVLLAGGVVGLSSTRPAYAHDGEDNGAHHANDMEIKVNRQPQKTSTIVEGDQPKGQRGKLNDIRQKVCQTREKTINNIMRRIATKGEKQIGVFNKIAERTQAFYVSKGLNLSNYDDLVAAVNAKKAAAQAAVAAVKASSVDFKCDGSDPQGAGRAFKDNLKKEKAALKEYKTAVKNLIRAVKSANSSASDGGQQ